MKKIRNLRATLACMMATMPWVAAAQQFPVKPVRVIVPFAAGGGSDMMAREIAEKLRQRLGQPVLVDNKPGAGTMLGSEFVAKSAPDGYTLLSTSASFMISPSLYAKPLYDPIKDFAPITQFGSDSHVVVVNPQVLPVKSMAELIAYMKANPGKVSFGSAGTGSSPHLEGELLKRMAGVDMTHVPYKGSAPATADLLGGQIPVLFDALASTLPHIKSGRMRALGVPHEKRSPLLPDVPTIAEAANLPGYAVTIANSMLAPAGTPKDVVDRIYREVADGLKDPDLRARFAGNGVEIVASTPEQFAEFLKQDIQRWSRIIKASGAKAD